MGFFHALGLLAAVVRTDRLGGKLEGGVVLFHENPCQQRDDRMLRQQAGQLLLNQVTDQAFCRESLLLSLRLFVHGAPATCARRRGKRWHLGGKGHFISCRQLLLSGWKNQSGASA
jgi:hypothetical protein